MTSIPIQMLETFSILYLFGVFKLAYHPPSLYFNRFFLYAESIIFILAVFFDRLDRH